MTPADLARWARIRELLTQPEAVLLFNACQDKARGDREAMATLESYQRPTFAEQAMLETLTAQALLADAIADLVLS